MVNKVYVKIIEYEQGTSILADESPVVNDKDYCEVVETVSRLRYTWNGFDSGVRGSKDTTKEELIEKIIKQSKWDAWTEDIMHQGKTFADFCLDAPEVYDHELDETYVVNSIDNFINNCQDDDCYDEVITQLKKIASNEYEVVFEEEDTDDIDSSDIYIDFCDYSIAEIEKLINTANKMGIVKIPDGDGGLDTVMKGNRDYVFINNTEFDGNIEQAIIYTISDGGSKFDLDELKTHLIELQADNEDYYQACEREELEID